MQVALNEALVELDNLAERKTLAGRLVQSPGSLNDLFGQCTRRSASRRSSTSQTVEKANHEGLKVRRPESDRLERLVYNVEQLAAGSPLVLATLAKLRDELGRNV